MIPALATGSPAQALEIAPGLVIQHFTPPGEGKSKGYRSIILFRKGQRSFFGYGFPKSALGNISEDERRQFREMARHVLALTDAQLGRLVASGQFEEVTQDDQEIPK